MRYTLTNGTPVQVRKITADGVTTTNPTDEQIDTAGAGYPLIENPIPAYDSATQRAVWNCEIIEGNIVVSWSIVDMTADELKTKQISESQNQIEILNAQYELIQKTPLTLANGKRYKPCWLLNPWGPLLELETAFPRYIGDADSGFDMMTFSEFQTLYRDVLAATTAILDPINAQIYTLEAQLKTLTEAN